jgi:hypothetical protein
VCEHGACRLPAIAPEKLAAQIAPVRTYVQAIRAAEGRADPA